MAPRPFATVNRASGAATASHSALVRFDASSPTTAIASSATLLGPGPATTGFGSPSAGNGRVAVVGIAAGRSHFIYRVQGSTATLVAQESVTPQPGTNTRFSAVLSPAMAPDGTRVFFTGLNSAPPGSADYRTGLYVEQSGTLARMLDNTTEVPGSTVKFDPVAAAPALFFSPNGAHTLVRAGSKRADSVTGADRFGLYRYAAGSLTPVADNTSTAGGEALAEIGSLGAAITNDGTAYFFATAANRINLYRATGTSVELVLRNSSDFSSMTQLWHFGAHLYVLGFNAAFERVLLRIPVAGGQPAVALNFATHPAFQPLGVTGLSRLEIAGGQALVQVSTRTGTALSTALLYAPASDLDGNGTSGGGGGGGTPGNAGRLINLSVRTATGADDDTLIVGLALGGAGTAGTKAVLLRAVGPTLEGFGVGGALADPVMTVYQGQAQVAQNDDWNATAGAVFPTVGAFAFTAGSRDAALYNAALPSNSYSIQIAGKAGGTGIALAEIYDATASGAFTAATPRLVNVSARTQVGTGDNILIAGFVIGGQSPVRVLVRAVGPTLTGFGVGGALTDPRLEIFQGGARTAENDNWDAATAANFASVGAFNFVAGSKDAALVATLPPGSYTAQVSGVGGTTGIALVEVYELP
jgi:hypothetical protein